MDPCDAILCRVGGQGPLPTRDRGGRQGDGRILSPLQGNIGILFRFFWRTRLQTCPYTKLQMLVQRITRPLNPLAIQRILLSICHKHWFGLENGKLKVRLISAQQRRRKSSDSPARRWEYVKQFEQPDHLLPNMWIVVRIDGRGFTK